MAVCFAVLSPGDAILTMNLAHGGHLTHGSPVNFSGKMYDIIHYGVRKDDERIDYDEIERLARARRPKLILAGASAYPRTIDFERFSAIAKESGAILMVDMAHISGLVATGDHPSPVPHADFVTSTTHKTLRGPRSGFILCKNEWAQKVNSSVFPGVQGGPLMHVVAAKAVAFGEAATPAFHEYSRQVVANANALAEGLIAGGLRLVTGGTDNHLLLVDVTVREGLTGKIAEQTLDKAGITCNKNMIPYDPRKPMDPSGIRLGSPALTTRGMKEPQMRQVAKWILTALDRPEDESLLSRIRGEIREFCRDYPVPGITP
jgi:glycine hydroxymethyltransferase